MEFIHLLLSNLIGQNVQAMVQENLRVYMRIYKCYMRFIPPALTNQITVFVTTRI